MSRVTSSVIERPRRELFPPKARRPEWDQATGVRPTKVRPPYGNGGWASKPDQELFAVAHEFSLKVENWDVDTRDWERPQGIGPAKVVAIATILLLAASCASALERASRRYKQDRDYASLETIAHSLHTGMTKAQVEAFLGPPDYSPTDGQYNYSSNRENHLLVVDYRIDTRVTDQLQSFDLMTIGG